MMIHRSARLALSIGLFHAVGLLGSAQGAGFSGVGSAPVGPGLRISSVPSRRTSPTMLRQTPARQREAWGADHLSLQG